MKVVPVGGRGYDCNVFLVKDPGGNAYDLVDAGVGHDHGRILAEIAPVLDPHRVRRVVVTHEHFDHTAGLPRWKALGARVCTSAATAEKLRTGHDPASALFGFELPRVEVDHVLAEGDHVPLGGADVAVLETRGHSPGSLCFWHADSGTLFSGDTVFGQGGIGRFDFPDGDVRELYESILRLERLPVRALHCGHGASVEGDAAGHSLASSVRHVASCV